MLEIIFLLVLAGIWILFAAIQDLREREVANWLNFSLIVFAMGFRFFFCLFSESANGFLFFYQGLIGLGIFLILGNLFYYLRVFAGGDAKLMIALGAVLPLSESFYSNLNIFFVFFLIFLIIGAVYGLIYSLVLMFGNFKSFKKQFWKLFNKNKKLYFGVMFLGLVLILFGLNFELLNLDGLFFVFGILVFLFPLLFIFAKSIEDACMIKDIAVKDLREGDWLCEDVKVGDKLIKADWEGLGEKDIKMIQKSKKFVKIKQGIPFVPVFLISFLIFVLLRFYFGIL